MGERNETDWAATEQRTTTSSLSQPKVSQLKDGTVEMWVMCERRRKKCVESTRTPSSAGGLSRLRDTMRMHRDSRGGTHARLLANDWSQSGKFHLVVVSPLGRLPISSVENARTLPPKFDQTTP
ncbi:hypothetical protein FS749_002929 [Ceratobasidium sp. UAMH 11750]|nr:hypothetical protein FS749_002929 [Ceratobasidium sp. UAMH 11750]